jgi:hypothetical protein
MTKVLEPASRVLKMSNSRALRKGHDFNRALKSLKICSRFNG